MTVAIRRACGAGALSLPIPCAHWHFNLLCIAIVEIFAIGDFVRAERIDQHVVFPLVGEAIALDLHAGRQRLQCSRGICVGM